ncbi:PREDICTED: uncharacterized protein LOC104827335 [Tarenaya hassleriana]|uniref:uncharacterized protein LOC104827335 n=1 Tax=Tarenaya hassleriana TaxID=28532 RepID=UPI00053C82DA|nr:PREDICTED: uncharacterized protein LOC104827335 [Tarenaya hassleriana]
MVGLSVVLETGKNLTRDSGGVISPKPPQVLSKTAVMITAAAVITGFRRGSSHPDPDFLEHCSLCKKKLLSGKDIYMYKGCKFCTEECRSTKIFMDEEERLRRKKCSLDAIKTLPSAPPPSSISSPASVSGVYSRRRRGSRNRSGGFAY